MEADLLKKLYQGETKQEKPSTLSPEKKALILEGLKRLISYGLLNDPNAIRDWANGLADLEYEELVEGFRSAKDHRGYMSLGDLRGLCKKPQVHASHRPFAALERKPMEADEIKRRIAKLKGETGL